MGDISVNWIIPADVSIRRDKKYMAASMGKEVKERRIYDENSLIKDFLPLIGR